MSLSPKLEKTTRIRLATQTKCDITGKEIETMEPHLKIFRTIEVSKTGIEEITENFKTAFAVSRYLSIEESNMCNFCNSNCKSMLIKKNNAENDMICKSCLEEFLDKCRERLNKIEENYIHYDSTGFVVKYCADSSHRVLEVMRGEMYDTDFYISIGLDDISSRTVCIDMSNVSEFINYMEEEAPLFEYAGNCDLCGKSYNKMYNIGKSEYSKFVSCKDCKQDIISSIKDFTCDEKETIIAKRI